MANESHVEECARIHVGREELRAPRAGFPWYQSLFSRKQACCCKTALLPSQEGYDPVMAELPRRLQIFYCLPN